ITTSPGRPTCSRIRMHSTCALPSSPGYAMRQLMWFRTDLRVQDNTALHAALTAGPTIALYLISPGQWRAHDDAPAKVDFWLRNLAELARALDRLNVPLLIRQADTWADAPGVV